MATPEQIQRQYELEVFAKDHGIEKLEKNTRQLEEKAYASASVYGQEAIHKIIPHVIDELTESHKKMLKGEALKNAAHVCSAIKGIGKKEIALLASKVIWDCVFCSKTDNRGNTKNTLANCLRAIGVAVEANCKHDWYLTQAKELYELVRQRMPKSKGTLFVDQALTKTMTKQGIVWHPWPLDTQTKVGEWCLDAVIKVSGWFSIDKEIRMTKTVNVVNPTQLLLEMNEEVMRMAQLFSCAAWPMIIPPNQWTREKAGGYITNHAMRTHELVRSIKTHEKGYRERCALVVGDTPLKFVNRVQEVPLALSSFIVEVSEILQSRQTRVGKFKPVFTMEVEPIPPDFYENEESKLAWKRHAAMVRARNAEAFRESIRTRGVMECVAQFKAIAKEGFPNFYCPHSFDYRGRVYPLNAFLNVQSTDWEKSLVRFANEDEFTDSAEYWLAFQLGNTYGLDKKPMDERVQWAYDNTELITSIATCPLSTIPQWEGADEPWQFLAACKEWYDCVITKSKSTTGLMVGVDATCSGIQMFCGLTRDKLGGSMVNLLPSDKPSDIYRTVAEHALPKCPEHLRQHIDRKVAKKVVMTVPYNAGHRTHMKNIQEELKKREVDVTWDELNTIASAISSALDDVCPSLKIVQDWIKDEVTAKLARGDDTLEWSSPTGFKVIQRFNKHKYKRIHLRLLGKMQVKIDDGETPTVDKTKHKAATSPNYIHSLDAALLCNTILDFDSDCCVIHDSVLCKATEVDRLNQCVRNAYAEMMSENLLQKFADEIGALYPPPLVNTLDVNLVKDSTYFFS